MSAPPRLAVVYDLGSAGPADVLRAARGLCTPLFVYDRADEHPAEVASLLADLGETLDTTGWDTRRTAAELRRRDVAGIVTFAEYQLRRTAELAELLGLPYQDRETAERLTDKAAQRAALADAGVDTTRIARVDSPDGFEAALTAVGLPAVLKPAVGGSSRNTYLISSPEQGRELAGRLLAGAETRLVLEEYLLGEPLGAWGDYVSVESLTSDGTTVPLAVTGKFPLTTGFRETGMFVPADLPGELRAETEDLTRRALAALGLRHGLTHTEIKLTAAGPRLIEVNGRLGGHVADLVRRAGGPDLIRLALLAALGTGAAPDRPRWDRVSFQYFVLPPDGAGVVRRISGAGAVRALPGVSKVDLADLPRVLPAVATGASSRIGTVYGAVADHTQLRFLSQLVGETLRPAAEPEVSR
ncbi:ATP-grasp domain-containing protein [Amycolatopsis lurida]